VRARRRTTAAVSRGFRNDSRAGWSSPATFVGDVVAGRQGALVPTIAAVVIVLSRQVNVPQRRMINIAEIWHHLLIGSVSQQLLR
jgi:hypothetical protein